MAPDSKRILVAVNGDATDREVVELAIRLAMPSKAEIFAIFVIEVKRALPLDVEIQADLEQGEQVLERVEAMAAKLGHGIQTEILQAREVGPAIVDEAIARNVDLVVMGVTYKRKFGEFNLGRTVPYVLRNAPCRVLVSREPMQVTAGLV